MDLARLCDAERKRLKVEARVEAERLNDAEMARLVAQPFGDSRGRTAHCVRCGTSIGFNVDKPHCRTCYGKRAGYANEHSDEKFCHRCGEKRKVSKAKPLCRPCYEATA